MGIKVKKSPKKRPSFTSSELEMLAQEKRFRKIVWELWNKGEDKKKSLKTIGYIYGGKRKSGPIKAIIAERKHPLGSYFVYYPKPREALRFILASKHLKRNGYADVFRGCVGVLSFIQDAKLPFKSVKLLEVQGGFKYRESPELHNQLTKRHGAWRKNLLRAFFERMNEENVTRVTFSTAKEVPPERIERQSKAFLEMAKEYGFERTKSKMPEQHIEVRKKDSFIRPYLALFFRTGFP